jgi:hypothetical protein
MSWHAKLLRDFHTEPTVEDLKKSAWNSNKQKSAVLILSFELNSLFTNYSI